MNSAGFNRDPAMDRISSIIDDAEAEV